MKKIFYFIVITIFIISCNNNVLKKDIISEENIDSLYIQIPNKKYSRFVNFQFAYIDNKPFFICQLHKKTHASNEVYFFCINTKKLVKTVSIHNKIASDALLMDFVYINKDSILFIYDKYNKDSTFILVDINSKIKKVYNMDNPYFNKTDTSLWVNQPFIHYDNKLFFTTSRKCSDIGTKESLKEKYPIIGYLDLVKDTVVFNNDLWYQNIIEGVYYPWQARILNYTISHKGTILISFANSNLIKEWNYKNNTINSYIVKGQLVDTILPEPDIYYGQQSATEPYNSYINYDNKRKIYSRRTFLPKTVYTDFKNIVVLFDTNFNYIGEGYNTYYMFSNKAYYNQNSEWSVYISDYTNSIKLVKRKYKFGKLNIEKIRAKMQYENQKVEQEKEAKFCSVLGNNYKYDGYTDDLMINYTKKIFNIQDSTFVLFVITDQDCHSCDDYTLQFMQVNCPVINSTKTCLLLAGSNIDYFNRLTNKYNLTGVNNFAIDTTGVYTNYLHHFSMNNPRLLLVRNNKVVSDTIYMPDDLEQMVMNYIDFFNFQTE